MPVRTISVNALHASFGSLLLDALILELRVHVMVHCPLNRPQRLPRRLPVEIALRLTLCVRGLLETREVNVNIGWLIHIANTLRIFPVTVSLTLHRHSHLVLRPQVLQLSLRQILRLYLLIQRLYQRLPPPNQLPHRPHRVHRQRTPLRPPSRQLRSQRL